MGLNLHDFDAQALTQAEDMYNKAQITPVQRKMIEPFGKVVSKFVPITEIAIRGFCLMGIVDWQKAHNKPLSIMENASPKERISTMQELTTILGEKLKKILRVKGPEKEQLVDKGMKSLMEFYIQQFSKR